MKMYKPCNPAASLLGLYSDKSTDGHTHKNAHQSIIRNDPLKTQMSIINIVEKYSVVY